MSFDLHHEIEDCLVGAFQEEQTAQRCHESQRKKEALEKRKKHLHKAAELFIERLYGDIQEVHAGKIPEAVIREYIDEYRAKCAQSSLLAPDRNEMYCIVVTKLEKELERGDFS